MTQVSRIVPNFHVVDFSDIDGKYLSIIMIYDHPLDFPDYFAARLWVIRSPELNLLHTDVVMLSPTLEGIREGIPDTFSRFMGAIEADPKMLESWVAWG